ncbi:MAG TPA: DNA polymerase III subunit delta [Candidatus Limnocylindrales bacterium]|nr:DNA polymerase III subunit delta [Candidatus Limnocylindrales bacterium]
MTTTLTGSNHFLVQAELRKLVKAFVAEHTEMGLQRFDGEEAEYDQIREALESLPFLASKKLVVLRNPSANKEFVARAEQLLANLPDSTDLIIHEPKLDKRSVYYKYLRKHTTYKEFNELEEAGLIKWLCEQAKSQGGNLDSSVARYLIERLGPNQQLLHSELAKLLAYNPSVSRPSIDLLTEPTPQSTIFQLLDAAFAGNPKKALKIYQEQRAGKTEPLAIIGMLAWQLHIVALIVVASQRSDAEIAQQAKISPYVVRKSRQIARELSLAQVRQLISRLLELDLSIKTTSIDADDALQTYLLNIST